MNMKKILYIISAALIIIGCSDKNGGADKGMSIKDQICGEWHSNTLPTEDSDIYISLGTDGVFELYQKIGDGDYRLYRGTWSVEGNLLTGKYNDGEDWGASYNVTVKDDSMTLTSNNEAAQESTFDRCSIPEEVKDTPYVEVKGMPAL